ncbi:uncharacterized protein E0L32_011822 [Thyridium curvatum]|uniref:Major facilitator superfamily (MFS) profile domain-containing protein n=1 Tax=Thyridium curvatum TaxID=1093900 RepID=A0A507BMU4_9PEZI|nr:uncharacterized protein E0L32_011822 [Thyridium curvatum]TPX18098.1 hypothetical protein E0L32_011822 [Thyridium curvatum]
MSIFKREKTDVPAPSSTPTSDGNSVEEAEADTRDLYGFRWFLACAGLYVATFLYGLDTTIAADVQGPVTIAFGHVEQLAWVGAGFPLGSVCVILLLGDLYWALSAKWVFLSAVVLFEVGSTLCGAAPSMSVLIIGRVVAGAGGSGIFTGVLRYLSAMTTEKERGFYMSLIGITWGSGAVLGPVIGGAFSVSSATWRWAFYINLVIGAVVIPSQIMYLPPLHPADTTSSIFSRLSKVDLVGFLLGAGVWTTFLLAFTMAGSQWPWNDGRTISTFAVFGVVLLLYVLQQYFSVFTSPTRRAFPGHLLRDRTQVLLYIVTAASITVLFVAIYYIPIYFQFVNDDHALMAAVRLLPFVIIAISTNLAAGSLLHLIKMYMVIYVLSGVLIVVAGGLLVVYLHPDSSTGTIYGLTVVIGLGAGLTMLIGFPIASLTAKPADVGAALSMQNISQIGGQVIALAVAGQIYQSTAEKKLSMALSGLGFSHAEIQSAVAGAQSSLFTKLKGEARERAVRAVTEAMQMTFVLLPVSGGILLIAALLMKRERLFGKTIAVGG